MKRLMGALTTTAGGAVLCWAPALAWGIAVSFVLITVTGCTLITYAFLKKNDEREDWLIKVIIALRKGT